MAAVDRPCGVYNETYSAEFAVIRTHWQWVLTILGLIFLFTLPLYCSGYALSMINRIGITLIAILGLGILTGYCGQISIGQAAFMAVGAYTTAILTGRVGISFWAALPCAALAAGAVGLVFGLPSLRVKGFYLAMATLAAQFIIPWVLMHTFTDITGGTLGLRVPPISIAGKPVLSQAGDFYVVMPFMVLGIYFAKNLARSKIGRAFVAIRDNDLAAEVMGINIFRYKLLAFFICSLYAGVAGALWAHWMRDVNAANFTLMWSVLMVGMLVVGGLGSVSGACFGTIALVGLDELTRHFGPALGGAIGIEEASTATGLAPLIVGLVILLFLIFEPRGLAHRWQIFKNSYRLWPFSY
jgi:branched-chain amino acid transport system permease protein